MKKSVDDQEKGMPKDITFFAEDTSWKDGLF
jgi:hypothetical protein